MLAGQMVDAPPAEDEAEELLLEARQIGQLHLARVQPRLQGLVERGLRLVGDDVLDALLLEVGPEGLPRVAVAGDPCDPVVLEEGDELPDRVAGVERRPARLPLDEVEGAVPRVC